MYETITFQIVTHDNYELTAEVKVLITGSFREATFHHEAEDEREIDIENIAIFDEDGDPVNKPSKRLIEIVEEHIDDNFIEIYRGATTIDDFHSDYKLRDLI
jgi:hypothetical protein